METKTQETNARHHLVELQVNVCKQIDTTRTMMSKELQNNIKLTYDECFGKAVEAARALAIAELTETHTDPDEIVELAIKMVEDMLFS